MLRFIILLTLSLLVRGRVEISCSVFLYGANDWKYDKTSNCVESVKRVRTNCGGKRINFVPTAHWIDTNRDFIPEGFAYKWQNNVVTVTKKLIDEMQEGVTICFDYALKSGFDTIEITPHLDDGLLQGAWRNALILNPFGRYSGSFSYFDIMIQPLARALRRVSTSRTKIYFSVQGEMNKMVVTYPKEMLQTLKQAKLIIGNRPIVKGGISLNFNKLCGMNACDPTKINVKELQNLFQQIDFMGMSSYPSTNAFPRPYEFSGAIKSLAEELLMVGVDLRKWLKQDKHELHFSEFGIGGGTCESGNCVANTFKDATNTPYYGIFGDYKRGTDPWIRPQMGAMLTNYYKQLIKWANEVPKYEFPVSSVFLWNVASWDITGIYHTDTTTEGTYKQPYISFLIKQWNNNGIIKK
jgi:hypothetical protein